MKKHWPVWVLLLISAIVYHRWPSFGIFANGDYGFTFSDTFRDFWHYPAWDAQSGFGNPNLVIWMWCWKLLPALFGLLGADSNIADKFIIFWPFAFLTPLFSYLLAKQVLKDKAGAFVAALVFSFNTYYLAINTQGHFSLTLAGTFALPALYFFWRYFEDGNRKWLVASAIITLIVGGYDFRVAYILFFILIALPLWFLIGEGKGKRWSYFRRHFWSLVIFFLLVLLFNLFWLWPTAVTGSLANNNIVDRSLVPNNFSLDLAKTLTLFHPFWNGSEPVWFDSQDVPVYFWLVPLLAFLGFWWHRRDRRISFWFVVALVAVFLSKQDADPLTSAYVWLHRSFPGFNAFREASKFYFAIALSYALLIGAFVSYFFERYPARKILKYGAFTLASLLFLWNTEPILTGGMYKMFTPKKLSADDQKLHALIASDPQTFRTLWIEKQLSWGESYSVAHPIFFAPDGRWRNLSGADTLQGGSLTTSQQNSLFFSQNFATRVLAESGVRYLIIDQSKFSPALSTLVSDPSWKKQDVGLQDYLLYENQSVRPRIYVTDGLETIHRDVAFDAAEIHPISAARWDFTVPNPARPEWIEFAENYHPDWQLVCGDFRWYDQLGHASVSLAQEHLTTDAGLNAFLIDPEKLERCPRQGDRVKLSLYYRPQSYLDLGGIISLSAVLISLGWLVFPRRKRHNGDIV